MKLNGRDVRNSLEALAGFFIGNLVIFSAPLYIGGLIDSYGLSEARAGLICSLEISSVACSCVLLSSWLRRMSLRLSALFGIALISVANVLTLFQDQFIWLLILRVLAGIGAGVCLASSSAIISRANDPDRVTGRVVSINTILVALFLVISGYGKEHFLFNGFVLTFLLALALAVIPMVLLPGEADLTTPDHHTNKSSIADSGVFCVGLFGVVLLLVFCFVEGSIWSFSERSGLQLGLSESGIGVLLALAQLAGLLGASCCMIMGDRIRREIPLILGAMLVGLAGYFVYNTTSVAIYQMSLPAFSLGFFLAFPYLIAGCARLDRTGKWAARATGVNLMGAATAPVVAGGVIETFGYAALGQMVLLLAVYCCVCGLVFSRLLRSSFTRCIQSRDVKAASVQ
jgi:predicted MFS family arabinose efflux permease